MNLKLAHSADTHLGEHGGPMRGTRSIRDLCLEALLDEHLIPDIEIQQPDVIVFPGDGFLVRRPSCFHVLMMLRMLRRLTQICPVVITPGNHDQLNDGRPGIWDLIAKMNIPNLYYLGPTPSHGDLMINGHLVSFYGVPYPQRHWLTAAEQKGKSLNEINRALVDKVMEDLKLWSAYAKGEYKIALVHASVTGARLPSGSLLLADGEPVLPTEEIEALGLDYVALGHIHKHQRVTDRMYYPGAPERFNFGEIEDDKGYLMVQLKQNAKPLVEFRPLPATRFTSIELDATQILAVDDYDVLLSGHMIARAIVDFRIQGTASDIALVDQPALIAAAMAGGALYVNSVKRHSTSSVIRQRNASITEQTDPKAALTSWLLEQKLPDPELLTQGVAIIQEVEAYVLN